MPIAIAPVDRERWTILCELFLERCNQISILLIDWTDAAKHLVVMCHLQHAFARHIPPTQHVLEERHHVIYSLRPAKRNQQQRIVIHFHPFNPCTISTSAITFSTGVSGKIPCPRLKICPGRPPA